MKEICEILKEEFDYVLIDSPAGIEHGFRNAIAGADEAIVVTTPEVAAVRDADRIIGMLEAHEMSHPSSSSTASAPTWCGAGDMMDIEDVIEILAIKLLGVVPDDQDVIVATNKGEPVVLTGGLARARRTTTSSGALKGEDVPLMHAR